MDGKVAGLSGSADWRLMREPESGVGGQQLRNISGSKSMNDKEKLGVLAKEFESIFLGQMLKSMRSTIGKSSLIDGGHGEEIFTGLMDEELSRKMAFSQNGPMSTALAEQMAAKLGKSADATSGAVKTQAGKAYKQTGKVAE